MKKKYRWIKGGSVECTGSVETGALAIRKTLLGSYAQRAYQQYDWQAWDPWRDSQVLESGRAASADEAKAHIEIWADTMIANRIAAGLKV